MTCELSSRGAARFREVSEQLLSEGLAVRFRAGGVSMEPAIRDGDLITVARVSVDEVKRGDVVFYASGRRTIAHRVVEIRRDGAATPTFIVRGDAREECDAPVVATQIIGKVVAVERAKRLPFWKRLLVVIAGGGRRPEPIRRAPQDPPRI